MLFCFLRQKFKAEIQRCCCICISVISTIISTFVSLSIGKAQKLEKNQNKEPDIWREGFSQPGTGFLSEPRKDKNSRPEEGYFPARQQLFSGCPSSVDTKACRAGHSASNTSGGTGQKITTLRPGSSPRELWEYVKIFLATSRFVPSSV